MAYNFVKNTLIAIMLREFVGEQLSSVTRDEAKSWRPQIQKDSEMGTAIDTMADKERRSAGGTRE